MKKKSTQPKKRTTKPTGKSRASLREPLGELIIQNGYPDLSQKKKRLTTTSTTLITTDEEVYFTIQRPGSNEITVKVEAYFAHVTVSNLGALVLEVYPSTPVTSYFTVPSSSGFFDGDASVLLENEATTLTFELSGETFEDEEQGNTLLILLVRGTEGTSPNQVVHESALVYNVISPYVAVNKKKRKTAKKKK